MGKENYSSKVYKFLARNMAIDYNNVSEADFNEKMKSPDFAKSMYAFMQEAQKNGTVGTLKPYEEFVSEFGTTTTPTPTTETDVVTEEETPQQGVPARRMSPIPQALVQRVQPPTNQPQPTAKETQIAPIDQQAGQVQGGMPISGDVLANAPKQEFQWSGQAPTKPVVQPQTGMPQTREEGMQQGGINPVDLGVSTLGSFETSLIGGIGSELKGISELGYSLDKKIVGALEGTPLEGQYAMLSKPEDSWIYQAGQGLQNFAEENLYRNPEYQGGVADIVGQGLGSIAAISATGGLNPAGGVMKLGTKAMTNPQLLAYGVSQVFKAPSISGALMMVGQETDEARKLHRYANSVPKDEYVFNRVALGESEEDASKAYDKLKSISEDEVASGMIPFALFSGATEAIPMERLFTRLGKASKDIVISAFKNGGIQGTEEAIQEMIQQTISNVGKGQVYNEAQRLSEGLVESAEGGGATGFVLGSILTALAGKRANIAKAVADGTMTKEEAIAELSDINKAQTLVNDKLQALDNVVNSVANEDVKKLTDLPESKTFFDKNEASLTNPITTMPTQVETIMDKIDGGILISAESLHEAYQWTNNAVKETLANQTLTPAEKGATLNILNGMLTDIDKATTFDQASATISEESMYEQMGEKSPRVQKNEADFARFEEITLEAWKSHLRGEITLDEYNAIYEESKPKLSDKSTPSITKAREVKKKQAGTTTLPSSGQTIVTPAPATTEAVATETEVVPVNVETDKGKMEGAVTEFIDVNDSRVSLPEKGYLISDVYLNEGEEKGVGSGQEIYKKALDEHGVLYSAFPISEDAIRVQDKLVEKGIAKIETITLSDGTEIRKITPQAQSEVTAENPALADVESTAKALEKSSAEKISKIKYPRKAIPTHAMIAVEHAGYEAPRRVTSSNKNEIQIQGYGTTPTTSFLSRLIENGRLNRADFKKGLNIRLTEEYATKLLRENEDLFPSDLAEPKAISSAYHSAKAKPESERTAQEAGLVQAVEQLLTPTQDAVQKQTAGQVPVQSGTTSSQEVAKGEPQAEPQSTADKGQTQETGKEEVGIPKEIAELYQKRSQLEFTKNALEKQMGNKPLVGKSKKEYDNIVSELASVESQIKAYEDSKTQPQNVSEESKTESLKTTTTEPATTENDYANYLLDLIEQKQKELGWKDSAELRAGLAKQFNETLSDRGLGRAISDLENTYVQYLPEGVRAGAYQTLKKNFDKQQATQEEVGATPTAEVDTEQAPAKKTLSEEFGISADDVNNLVEQKRKTFEGYSVEMALQELGVPQDKIKDALPAYVAEMLEGTLPTKSPVKKQKIDEDLIPEGEIKIQPIPSKGKGKPAKTTAEKIDLVSDATDNKSDRDYAKVVHKNADNKEVVATDAHVMIVVKDDSITETESVDVKTGQKADVRYPDYKSVIPDTAKRKDKKKVNAKTIYDLASGIAKATKMFTGRIIPARIVIGDTELFVPAENLKRGLEPFVRSGITDIEISVDGPNRAVVFKGGDITSIVMPVQHKGENAGYTTIISEEQATPTTKQQATAQATPTAETTATETATDSVIGTEWDSREGKKKITGEITIKGKKYYTISIDGKSSNALILDSELQDEIKFDKVSFEEKQANEIERAEAESKKKEEADKDNDIKGFGDNLSPMQKAKVVSVLNVLESYNGVVKKRKNAIEDFVKEGRFVSTLKSGKKVLMSKDGSFLELSKTQIDYAEYLIENDVLNQTPTTTPALTPVNATDVEGKKSILNSDTNLKGAKETVLRNGVESTQIDKPNNINVEDNSQRWWIYHNVITGEKIIHSEYGWDYDLDGNRLSVDYNKKVLDNNSLFKKEEPKSNLLDAILKKERGWEARVTESKDLAQLESIEKELQTNEKLKQAFGFNGKVYDQTGKDFYSRLNYLRSHPEKVVSENVSVKEPLVNEKLRTAIAEGRMTADDAKAIIESAGLDVPQDILAQTKPTAETVATTTETTGQEGGEVVETEDVIIEQQPILTKEDKALEGKRQSDILIDSVKPELRDYAKKLQDFFLGKGPNPNTEIYNSETKTWENKNDFFENQDKKDIFYLFKLMFSNLDIKEIENELKQHVKAMNFYEGKKPITPTEFIARLFEPSKTQVESKDVKLIATTAKTEIPTLTPVNATDVETIAKIENATEKGRELALNKPTNKGLKRAFDNFQDLSSRARKAGIYDGKTLKIGGQEIELDTPAKFKAFLANQGNFDAITEAVKDIPSEQKTDTNPSPKTVEEKSKEVFNDAKSTFVFPIGLNPKFKFDSRLPENVVRFFKKYFRPRGLWTKGMFSAKRGMENQISAQQKRTEFAVKDLKQAVNKAYPKGITNEQLSAINDFLQGYARELPANLYKPIEKMREHIDELSRLMISEGIIDERLVPVFDANMGIYTTRTYAIHNDPEKWIRYINEQPEGQQIRNNAVNFVRQATEAKADRLDKFADENEKRAEKLFRRAELAEGDEALMLQAKADEVIARADRQRELASTMREQDFDAQIDAFLFAEGQPLDIVRKGNVGAKDLGVLKKRKNIPDEFRALMGEEKDPLTNYTMSIAKMSALIANNQFLNEVKEQGLASGLFSKTPQGKNVVQIASASTDSMSPLNGLYTTKDIAEAFKEFDANTKNPWYVDAMLWVNAVVKINKTVLSEQAVVRNFLGNPIIELANGYIPTFKGRAINTQMEEILNRRFGDRADVRGYIERLTKLGVLGQGGNYREIQAIYEDLKGKNYDYQKLIEPAIKKAGKATWNVLQKIYKGGDEFWKVVAFENERAVFEKAYGDTKTDEELDEMTATKIRRTRVDYSMAPKAVKVVNKFPFAGTFVTFPAEIIRIGANIPVVAYEEMNSGNKVLIEHGIKRMAGYMTAMTLSYGLSELTRYLAGMDDEEEEARKQFLAPWTQNSTLAWVDKNTYVDTGFSDAFSILKKPIVGFIRGADFVDGSIQAVKEFLGPLISEEIGYKTYESVKNNRDEYDNPIYDENAEYGTKVSQIASYVLKKVEPGTVSQIRRLYLGETGALSEKGQKYSTTDEVTNATFGIKRVTVDWPNAVSFKFRDGVEKINSSNKFFLKATKELRKNDVEGRRKAAESTNLAIENTYNDLRKYYTSALKIGMLPKNVEDIMRESGVSNELIDAVVNNTGYNNYLLILNDGTVLDRQIQRQLKIKR